MKFSQKDSTELAKIGVFSLLDLALALPKSYDDLSVRDEPNVGENTVLIECKSVSYRGSGLFIVSAFCLTWECEIRIVIFNAKSWHHGIFKIGKQLYIHGKSDNAYGGWQFTNPKVVTKVGEIIPKYKNVLTDAATQKLIARYVTHEALLGDGLREDEADLLIQIHQNNQNSVCLMQNLSENPCALGILKFVEIYNYLKKLRAKKTDFKAEACEPRDISEWLKSLPFTPTNDQLCAINDIGADLASPRARRRVVMGDVGSGKTLVILAAAFMNYPRISYLMVPTSILADQIYAEAKRLLPNFMNVLEVKSGEKSLDLKDAHLVIGTHALLFHNLAPTNLIMVDEQHRFGSNQRDKINTLTQNGELHAHFVQFSATPIPRTLSLIQSELVSFSFLREMPFTKLIHTHILQNSGFDSFMAHLKRELGAGRQAIIVYPLVEQSDKLIYQSVEETAPFWQERFNGVYVTHGRDKEKEETLVKFRDNGSLLITTTVVEVGISLPRLSTILIVGAERMGLASLHQLRGRVGRNGGEGWCYLYTKLKKPPARLEKFADTLDGFKVAQIDLENRQAGDLLDGSVQHGATFVWYDYDERITARAKARLERTASDDTAESEIKF